MLVHFANGLAVLLLTDTLLRGRNRPVALATALLFVFHALQIESHFAFPTGGHRKSALLLSLVSLWLFTLYVRGGRANRWQREGALALYIAAVATYEQTALFFLLHPVIALFEDTRNGALALHGAGQGRALIRWAVRVALDSIWYPVFIIVYLFMLRVLFPEGRDHLSFSPTYIWRQFSSALWMEFNPADFWARLSPALTAGGLWLTALAGAAAAALVGWATPETASREARRDLWFVTVLGAAIMLVSIAGVAPTAWILTAHPRLIYPTAVGFGMLAAGGLTLLLTSLPNPVLRRGVFVLAIGVLVGGGAGVLFYQQGEFLRANNTRQAVLNAVKTAIPVWAEDAPPPYILLVSDSHISNDLALNARDSRFPYLFDLLYEREGILVDGLYYDVDPALAPPDDLPGARYNGQFIVVEPEGIYSPLLPFVPIDPARLVIVYYDSKLGTARVLDSLTDDLRTGANIVERAPLEWATNWRLIP
jgi:hypothetical protein